MHDAVGGTYNRGERRCDRALMAKVPCAGQDPIFWLHHANIDRLWAVWMGKHDPSKPTEFANPTDKAWREARYTFADEKGAKQRGQMPKDYLDLAKLGYSYGDMPPAKAGKAAPARAGVVVDTGFASAEMAGASRKGTQLVGESETLSLVVPSKARSVLDEAAPAASEARLLLKVENVRADHNPGTAYHVYLTVGRSERRRLGSITLFGIEAINDPDAAHEGDEGLGFTFDVTDVAAELSAAQAWDPNDISVTFEPFSLVETAQGAPVREFADSSLTPITVGRVSLFVED
jgi:tyrosinase